MSLSNSLHEQCICNTNKINQTFGEKKCLDTILTTLSNMQKGGGHFKGSIANVQK